MDLGLALLDVGVGERPAEFARFTQTVDPAWIDAALAATGTATVRRRRLPAERVAWLVIGMGMFRDRSIAEVVEHLDLVLPATTGRAVTRSQRQDDRQRDPAERGRAGARGGANMVGRPATLPGVTQINVLDTLGMISTSFADWQGVPGGQHVELTDNAAGKHLSLQFSGDVLVGCNAIGWTQHVGVMRGLVEGRVRLGAWKDRLLQDPTLLMEAYLDAAQAQAHLAHLK